LRSKKDDTSNPTSPKKRGTYDGVARFKKSDPSLPECSNLKIYEFVPLRSDGQQKSKLEFSKAEYSNKMGDSKTGKQTGPRRSISGSDLHLNGSRIARGDKVNK